MRNAVILSASAAILAILLSGCMAKRTLTQTPRSGIEQLLLAGAAERAVNRLKGPDLRGAHVSLEVAGMTKDADFAKEAVASELQSRGAVIVSEGIKATHIVKILVLALGTDQSETFIGIPAMNSFLLPIPEITFFRRQRQTARSRLRFTVIEARTGRMVGKAEEVDGETAFSRLTILPLVFEWSDIDDRPRGRKEAARPNA